MKRPNLLAADCRDGKLFAAVDASARYVTPKVQEMRFAASLSPFPDRAAAEAALTTAGASNIKEVSK
jgi:hypothetical protein